MLHRFHLSGDTDSLPACLSACLPVCLSVCQPLRQADTGDISCNSVYDWPVRACFEEHFTGERRTGMALAGKLCAAPIDCDAILVVFGQMRFYSYQSTLLGNRKLSRQDELRQGVITF